MFFRLLYPLLAVGFAVQIAVFLYRGRFTRRRLVIVRADQSGMFYRAIGCYAAIDLLCWVSALHVFGHSLL